jgi:hypothetical protein
MEGVHQTGTPLLTSADVTSANASLAEGQYVLNVEVTPVSAPRVQLISQRNVGRTMAFIVDGQLIRTPKSKTRIIGTGVLIGGFERAEAERRASGVAYGVASPEVGGPSFTGTQFPSIRTTSAPTGLVPSWPTIRKPTSLPDRTIGGSTGLKANTCAPANAPTESRSRPAINSTGKRTYMNPSSRGSGLPEALAHPHSRALRANGQRLDAP